jgi:serine/threonine-protein kinase/endoribonuclease IRE1
MKFLPQIYIYIELTDFIFLTDTTTHHTSSNTSGSIGWTAYESTRWNKWIQSERRAKPKWKRQSDIQVAGMLAFYIYTKGDHPFGSGILQRMTNLLYDKPVGLTKLSGSCDAMVKDLLAQMLAQDVEKRPYVKQALQHPYFLSPEEQMKFLEAVGNQPEIKNVKPDPCAVSRQLDNRDLSKPRSSLLPMDWISVIDPDDLNTLCAGGPRPSSFNGSRYTHCLRFIRNVRQHWGDKPTRTPLNGMRKATSLDEYFLQLFPTLPLVLHQIIKEYPDWKARPTLKEFFPADAD